MRSAEVQTCPALRKAREGDAARGDIDRRRRHDDEGIVARGLDQSRLERARAGLATDLRGLQAAGEGDAVDTIVLDEAAAGVAAPRDALHETRRKRRERFHQQQRRQRRQVRRLDDDGIAGADGGRDLPEQQQVGIVERDDGGDDAERLLQGHVELARRGRPMHASAFLAADLGVVAHGAGAPADLVHRLLVGLALLAGEALGERGVQSVRRPRHLVHDVGALGARERPPLLLGRGGDVDCRLDLARGRLRDLTDHFLGCRIDDRKCLALARRRTRRRDRACATAPCAWRRCSFLPPLRSFGAVPGAQRLPAGTKIVKK